MVGLRLRGQWLVPIMLGITSEVWACPVCGVGRGGTASVYLMTAVLMSIVPLVMFGTMAYYLLQRTKSAQHQPQSAEGSALGIPTAGEGGTPVSVSVSRPPTPELLTSFGTLSGTVEAHGCLPDGRLPMRWHDPLLLDNARRILPINRST